MQLYVVHIVGLIGNIIGFIYTSSRYLGTGYGSIPQTWGISNEICGLIPMLVFAIGILINGLFLSLKNHFKFLVSFTTVSIINTIFLLLESINDITNIGWISLVYEQNLLIKTLQISLAFLSSSIILLFLYKNSKV
ncbi:hypothetical protein [Bacillus sp. 196mf]|uniref:hypothetical protein n=1 Tax=Bacillus sp. 196mf TaxID=1761754 RepID=UPI000D7C34BD|nr:hypothetical protein [Bacillus sp. 196mf]PYE87927.1 hypothetical protein ATL10_10582 [Bacillus sp. 196mf]